MEQTLSFFSSKQSGRGKRSQLHRLYASKEELIRYDATRPTPRMESPQFAKEADVTERSQDSSMLSRRETDWLKESEIGVLRAMARAIVMDAALGKRASGSFARLRNMTCARADEMVGFISAGGVGEALRCCTMIATGLFPRKGRTPVQSSYSMTPRA